MSEAVDGLVQSMGKLEGELDKKIGQLRQILDEVKAVRQRTDDQLGAHQGALSAL